MLTPWSDDAFMLVCLQEAHTAAKQGHIPVGAAVADAQGRSVAVAHNTSESPTEHAEILVIREACKKLKVKKLEGFTLYTTLEPCIMCAGAILNAHLSKVKFGAWDEKFGASGSVWDLLRDERAPYHPEVYAGLRQSECRKLLEQYFRSKRLGN
jgi:tRNA(adenine34) deaminase